MVRGLCGDKTTGVFQLNLYCSPSGGAGTIFDVGEKPPNPPPPCPPCPAVGGVAASGLAPVVVPVGLGRCCGREAARGRMLVDLPLFKSIRLTAPFCDSA